LDTGVTTWWRLNAEGAVEGRLENSTMAAVSGIVAVLLTVNVDGPDAGTVVGEEGGERAADDLGAVNDGDDLAAGLVIR